MKKTEDYSFGAKSMHTKSKKKNATSSFQSSQSKASGKEATKQSPMTNTQGMFTHPTTLVHTKANPSEADVKS